MGSASNIALQIEVSLVASPALTTLLLDESGRTIAFSERRAARFMFLFLKYAVPFPLARG